MEPRKFQMIYGGVYSKPAGLVYDNFDIDKHVIEPRELDPGTVYYGGIDWGYTDPFVIKIRAVTPLGFHYDIFEYYKTQCTISDMVRVLKSIEISMQIEVKRYMCDPSRPDYINELCRHGFTAVAANNDIRMGIDMHYELISSMRYFVFKGACPHTLDEYELYHYPEMKDLKPDQTQKDELPVDKDNHAMDVSRYITMTCYKPMGKMKNRVVTHTERQERYNTPDPWKDTELKKLMKKKKSQAWKNAL